MYINSWLPINCVSLVAHLVSRRNGTYLDMEKSTLGNEESSRLDRYREYAQQS